MRGLRVCACSVRRPVCLVLRSNAVLAAPDPQFSPNTHPPIPRRCKPWRLPAWRRCQMRCGWSWRRFSRAAGWATCRRCRSKFG